MKVHEIAPAQRFRLPSRSVVVVTKVQEYVGAACCRYVQPAWKSPREGFERHECDVKLRLDFIAAHGEPV